MAEKLRFGIRCPHCSRITELELDADKYYDYVNNKVPVQDAFPDLIPDKRELLITGICGKCWKEIFKDTHEDDEND